MQKGLAEIQYSYFCVNIKQNDRNKNLFQNRIKKFCENCFSYFFFVGVVCIVISFCLFLLWIKWNLWISQGNGCWIHLIEIKHFERGEEAFGVWAWQIGMLTVERKKIWNGFNVCVNIFYGKKVNNFAAFSFGLETKTLYDANLCSTFTFCCSSHATLFLTSFGSFACWISTPPPPLCPIPHNIILNSIKRNICIRCLSSSCCLSCRV